MKKIIYELDSEYIKVYCKANKIKISDLSLMLGWSKTTLRRYVSHYNKIPTKRLIELSEYLGVSDGYLLKTVNTDIIGIDFDKLESIMKDKGITVSDLGRESILDSKSIMKMFNNKKASPRLVKLVCEYIEIEPKEIYTGTNKLQLARLIAGKTSWEVSTNLRILNDIYTQIERGGSCSPLTARKIATYLQKSVFDIFYYNSNQTKMRVIMT